MYSNKFAAKLVNIKELCKYIADKLRIIRVLSTYYLTFRIINSFVECIVDSIPYIIFCIVWRIGLWRKRKRDIPCLIDTYCINTLDKESPIFFCL